MRTEAFLRQISLDRFEWGWLVKAGYVGLGKFERHLWVKKGYNIPFIKRLLSQQIKYYIQIVTAVAKAHSDAADIQGDGQGIPYEFDTVIEQSFVVRRMAQAELGKLEGEFVLIAIQNATTTAINLVELSIKEEIETLARLGQLTGPESQKMEEIYYEEIHHNMAAPLEVHHHVRFDSTALQFVPAPLTQNMCVFFNRATAQIFFLFLTRAVLDRLTFQIWLL